MSGFFEADVLERSSGESMTDWKYKFFTPSNLLFGSGVLGLLTEQLKDLKANKTLVVTDGGMMKTGLIKWVMPLCFLQLPYRWFCLPI